MLPDLKPVQSFSGKELLLQGWTDMGNIWFLLDMSIVLLMALILGAAIAYHPSTRRRMFKLEHYEQPKTFLMYSMVAAVVALIVKQHPEMAMVVFGIGGLMRFRTMVGDAKDTGRVILVTVIGLCCGLKLYTIALPATLIAWIVVYILEKQTAGQIRVSGVESEKIKEAVPAYRALIGKNHCRIIGEQSKFIKREFIFVIVAPPQFDKRLLQSQFEKLPEQLQGKVDWERL